MQKRYVAKGKNEKKKKKKKKKRTNVCTLYRSEKKVELRSQFIVIGREKKGKGKGKEKRKRCADIWASFFLSKYEK